MTRTAKAPTRPRRWAMAHRLAHSDDSGATLLMALIFITVVAVVIGTLLAFVDASMRGTIAVRAQAAQAAAADGAAQVAVNALRKSAYTGATGSTCLQAGNKLSLANFSPASSTNKAYSAAVTCDLDTTDSVTGTGVAITSSNRPSNSILSLSTDAAEDGVNIHTYFSSDVLQVHGDIFSNSNVDVDKIVSDSTVTARKACSGTIVAATKACNIGGSSATDGKGVDPNYMPTVLTGADAKVKSAPTCALLGSPTKVYTFSPGIYTNLGGLNTLTNNGLFCTGGQYYFPPGTYYFDFDGEWTISRGWLIGGTASLSDTSAPSVPGACKSTIPPDPIPAGGWTPPGAGKGVEFVFGSSARINVEGSILGGGKMELCGSYSANRPPIAIYGLKANITVGTTLVHAQNGCITNPASSGGSHCPVLTSTWSWNNEVYVQGVTYTPLATINMQLQHSDGPTFRAGVVARAFAYWSMLFNTLANPISRNPDLNPGYSNTVVLLKVFVCPGTAACATTGNPSLKAKVGLVDPTGHGGARGATGDRLQLEYPALTRSGASGRHRAPPTTDSCRGPRAGRRRTAPAARRRS